MGVNPAHRVLPDTHLCENDMLQYCQTLSSVLSQIYQQVKDALPVPAKEPLHNIKPGDYVVVKDLRRKHWKSKRWNGPFKVLLMTHMAVKIAERATWIHASHCRKVPTPTDDTYGQTAKLSTLPHL